MLFLAFTLQNEYIVGAWYATALSTTELAAAARARGNDVFATDCTI
jgi:hypothetical protein